MLGLREHVGREMPRIAIGRDDEDFGGSGDEIDADLAGEQLFRGRDVDVARSDDAVGARHRASAVGEGRDGLRAAHFENVLHAEQVGRAEDFGHGTRRRHTNGGDAGDLRGNDGHQQRGGQGIAARGNVGGHGVERTHDLSEAQSGAHLARPFPRHLAFGVGADVARGHLHRAGEFRGQLARAMPRAPAPERARTCA